jgi:hypothetical protein
LRAASSEITPDEAPRWIPGAITCIPPASTGMTNEPSPSPRGEGEVATCGGRRN